MNNNNRVTEKKDIANSFNNFFSTIGEKLANNFNKSKINNNNYNIKNNKNSMFLLPTHHFEVQKIIKSLKNKAGGVDGISNKILKNISDYILDPLVYVINISIDNAIYPDHFKIAEVVPIFKSNEKFLPTNYRPISLISNLAKIYEKILHNRLNDFFTKNKIISKNQYGFIKNSGTKDAIADFSNHIYKSLDSSSCTAAVLLDFSKAFDTVNHNILLAKLETYGIRGKVFSLIKSYLSDRQQYVRVNGIVSNLAKINIGVPQGTILGPLFFIIYMNDIFQIHKNIVSYADDTVILCTDTSWEKTQEFLQNILSNISNWLDLNFLSLNTNKTVYMTFSIYKNKLPTNFEISINNCKLENVTNYKYLGLYIDQHMRFNVHVNNLVKKLRYFLYIFYNLKSVMNTKSLLTIYYGLFHSVATYGIIAWGNAYKNVVQKLFKLQDRVLRIILSTKIGQTSKYQKKIFCSL